MKTLVICGHLAHAQAVYRLVDEQLRLAPQADDVTICLTGLMDHATAATVQEMVGELWFCGPLAEPQGGPANHYLLADDMTELLHKAMGRVHTFLAGLPAPGARVPA